MPVLYCCRAVLPLAGQDPRLQTFIGTDMLRGSLAALSTTCSTAGSHQGDVLGLIRDILVQQLATQPGPRQVSLEHPSWDGLLPAGLILTVCMRCQNACTAAGGPGFACLSLKSERLCWMSVVPL